MTEDERLIVDAEAYLDDGLDDPKDLVKRLADRLATLTTAPEGDVREHLHAKCDCVPDLGPAHCHLCGNEKGEPVPWPECLAVRVAVPAETEGQRWYAACWRDDNGYLNELESKTVVREYAEAAVKRWKGAELGEPNGQPDRVVLATKLVYPWLPVPGGEGENDASRT